jgi:hypothetical protein
MTTTFRYLMFGKYNGLVSKARVSACMYFLVGNGKVVFTWSSDSSGFELAGGISVVTIDASCALEEKVS